MKTKELLKKLEDKSSFALAWAIMWRMWILTFGFYLVVFTIAIFASVLM